MKQRRFFIYDLEKLFEETHVWVRQASVHCRALQCLWDRLDEAGVEPNELIVKKQPDRLSKSTDSEVGHHGDPLVPQQSGLPPLHAAGSPKNRSRSLSSKQLLKSRSFGASVVESMSGTFDWGSGVVQTGSTSSDDDEDEAQTSRTGAPLTKAAQARIANSIMFHQAEIEALIRKVDARCDAISLKIQRCMPRRKTEAELEDEEEMRGYRQRLVEAKQLGEMLEEMRPYAAGSFETKWGQSLDVSLDA